MTMVLPRNWTGAMGGFLRAIVVGPFGPIGYRTAGAEAGRQQGSRDPNGGGRAPRTRRSVGRHHPDNGGNRVDQGRFQARTRSEGRSDRPDRSVWWTPTSVVVHTGCSASFCREAANSQVADVLPQRTTSDPNR